MPTQNRLSIRLSEQFAQRLKQVSETIGVEPATIGRACLEALVKHVEEYGSISLPVEITEKKTSEHGFSPASSGVKQSSGQSIYSMLDPEPALRAAEEPAPAKRATKPVGKLRG